MHSVWRTSTAASWALELNTATQWYLWIWASFGWVCGVLYPAPVKHSGRVYKLFMVKLQPYTLSAGVMALWGHPPCTRGNNSPLSEQALEPEVHRYYYSDKTAHIPATLVLLEILYFLKGLSNWKQTRCHKESLAQDRVRLQHTAAMALTNSKAPVALQHIKLRPGCCSWALGSDQGAASQRRNDRAHINDWFIHSKGGE